MIKTKKEYLTDYLTGLKSMPKASSLPIGCVIINDGDFRDVADVLGEYGVEIVEAKDHPDEAIGQIIANVKKGSPVALHVAGRLETKIRQLLIDLSGDQARVVLAGQAEPIIVRNYPTTGFVLIVLNTLDYENIEIGDCVTSFCNLTR